MDEDFLKIGDQICLYSDSVNGYLTSISFNNPSINIQNCSQLHVSHIHNLRNMIFQIVPKLSYDAMRELKRERKARLQKEENDMFKGEETIKDMNEFQIQRSKQETLERRVIINQQNNNKLIQDMHGVKVQYGMPIQLMHIDSGYFLQYTKRISMNDRQCQQLELVPNPSAQRVSFFIYPRFKYRQEGEYVVYNDHVLFYNSKYNAYLHISEDTLQEQVVRDFKPSEYRPLSPLRRVNPVENFKNYEVNMSSNFYKWQIISYRQIKNNKESQQFIFSGEVIIIKHAETSGIFCFDDQSNKRFGSPVFARIFKGQDENDKITTNCLFEVEIHNSVYNSTASHQGSFLQWRKQKNSSLTNQLVRFRHLNSGKLLTVKQVLKPNKQKLGQNHSQQISNTNRDAHGDQQSKREQGEYKLILTLSDNISTEEVNRRIEGIEELIEKNKFNINFNPISDLRILELNKSVDNDQVFMIENTIIDPVMRIKNLSVVKIKNIKFNQYVSTEIKRLDGDADDQEVEQEPEEGGQSKRTATEAEGTNKEQSQQDNMSNKQAEEEGQEKEEDQKGKFVATMFDDTDSIIFNATKMIQHGSMDDVFILEKFNQDEVKKILFIHSNIPKIKEFIYYIRNDPIYLKSPYMKAFEELLTKLVFFLTITDVKDPFTCEGTPIKQNQKYFRELKVIDLLIDVIIYPFEGLNAPFNLDQLTGKSPMIRICRLIYRVLKLCVKDNEHNKFYVAQWISHFFEQSMMTNEENNMYAQYTVTELLANNKPLLDKQINTQTIRNIVQNCSDNQKNEKFLNLLSALCQCNGEAISSNQDDICELLLEEEEFSHLLIKVDKIPGTNRHRAIFEEPEMMAANKGKPVYIEIEKMKQYFQNKKDMRMYNYFQSMIQLVSLMCLQRNYAGINSLQDLYNLEFTIDCFLNPNICYKMRSNFGKMLITLHIDKDPLENVNVPVLTRVWQEIAQKNMQIPKSRVKINPRILKIKDFIVTFFESFKGIQRSFEKELNMFVLEVLNITERMVNLGFYQNESELLKLIDPIIPMLDGSNDFHSKEEEEGFNRIMAENAEINTLVNKNNRKRQIFKRDKNIRYKSSEDNANIVLIKRKIIDILHRFMDIQDDIRLTTFLIEFYKSDNEMIHNPVESAKELHFLHRVLSGNYDPEEDQEIKHSCDEKIINWMRTSFLNKNLDMLFQSKQKDLICILLDIILYQDSKMVNSAFTLLTKYFTQKVSIIKYANSVQLLQDQQEVTILKKVSGDLREMKKNAENSEFWIGNPDRDKLKIARMFIDKLEMLTDLCIYRPNRVIDIDDKKKKKDDDILDNEEDQEDEFEFLNLTELLAEWDNEDPKVNPDDETHEEKNQILLKNLLAHIVPIIIIRQKGLDQSEDKNSFLKVLEKIYIFLIKFVRNNKINQLLLVDYLDLFIDDMEYGVHSWELIAEIFKNSELLLSYNLVPLIKRVIKLIDSLPKETQKKTTMLSFLGYFMKFNGNSIKSLQNIICLEITSVLRKNMDHLFVGELGLKDLHLYILEMKNAFSEFMNDDRYVQEIQIPPELSYTIEYIKLLAHCGEGKNALTEARAQEKLPIDDILENMQLADFCFPLKSALVYFMDSIYFDIEKDVSEENIQKMINFIVIISNDLERFLEIQQRTKQSKSSKTTKTNKKPVAQDAQEKNDGDLDGIYVDINKNFTMLTSFGSFPILYLIERYVFETVFSALTQFFKLKLPIKIEYRNFFKKLLQLIQKSTDFVVKESHKVYARNLFKIIKKIPQLKELGAETLHSKNLAEVGTSNTGKKQNQGVLGNIPQISQAKKLKAYIQSVETCDLIQQEFEREFEGLVTIIIQIHIKTEKAFEGTNTLDVKEIINALIKISAYNSDIDKNLRIVCLKVIRKVVEQENKNLTTPAFKWQSEDWVHYRSQIKQQQTMLINLDVVDLICDLIAYEQKLSIKEEALLCSVAILLGGNMDSQMKMFYYITKDTHNLFMRSLQRMIYASFELVKKTQIKRNNGMLKLLQFEMRIKDLKEMTSNTNKKKAQFELKKVLTEKKFLEEDLKDTEYNTDENPSTYTTDELTVARAINDLQLCLKLHQLFCENHNLVLQNCLRQQFNEDGNLKSNSFDFPTYYAKMLENFQKIFNNNTMDIGHQLIETLTESIQGPCKLNQKALVNGKILDSSREYIAGFETDNEVVNLGFSSQEDLDSLGEFKQKVVTLLTSLLEGEIDLDIMNRMAVSMDFKVMKQRMVNVFTSFAKDIMQKDEINFKELNLNKISNRLKKDSLDTNVAEAFEIYILMHSLADSIKDAEQQLNRDQFTAEQWKANEFIRSHMGRIEINVNNNLQRIYFPIRPVCQFLSPGAKDQLLNNVNRESQNTKVTGLMQSVPDLIDEMNQNEQLTRAILKITPKKLMALKDFSTIIGLMINFFFLGFAKKKYHYREPDIQEWVIEVIEILGIIQGVSSGVLILFYAINKKKLITQMKWRNFVEHNKGKYEVPMNNDRLEVNEMSIEMTHLILLTRGPEAHEFTIGDRLSFGNFFTWSEYQLFNIYFFIQDSVFQYYVLYFGISILGYLSSDIYYSFHLLDVISRFQTLQNVIRSVTSNSEQLGLTCVLMIIIVYIFTSLTFFYLQDMMYDYDINAYDSDIVGENNCLSMIQCFASILNKGLRYDGGIGDVTRDIHYLDRNEDYLIKLFHDITFLIMVKIIMLNVLFGIIIDTFAQLRDKKSRIDNDMVNVCFVCNFERLLFEKYSEGGMARHIAADHNLWMYVYYMVHLYTKDTSEHTGIESFVLQKFKDGDVSWLPRQKALCLVSFQQDGDDDEDKEAHQEKLRQKMKKWYQKINHIEILLDKLYDNMAKKEEEEAEAAMLEDHHDDEHGHAGGGHHHHQ